MGSMRVELTEFAGLPNAASTLAPHWLCLVLVGWLGCVSGALYWRTRALIQERRRERLLREELETYARLDASLPSGGDTRALAKRVCRMVAERSAFRRAALLLRDAEGRLYVAGSAGMDDLAAGALVAWGIQIAAAERSASEETGRRSPGKLSGTKSFVLELESGREAATPSARQALRGRVVVIPLRGAEAGGRIAGALVVGTDPASAEMSPVLEEALPPLEALAVKLARAIEAAALTERLLRVEKLAGLGQLAGGVAHELNNPLTAVLGFAELIAETSSEGRVRDDAHTIVTEALRMREIIQNLVNFWRPVTHVDEPVELVALVREVSAACAARLAERGVRLAVVAPETIAAVRGSAERLRVVLEHLLNNAAQAIGSQLAAQVASRNATPVPGTLWLVQSEDEEQPAIRVTVSESGVGDSRTVHVVVSDTGSGFREPTRVFDPFYTTRQPGEGSGLGLSICYGIVRELGGEISAFNLHPHGAAVVVELPVREMVTGSVLVRETA
jgi:signal transduction histidine kinase